MALLLAAGVAVIPLAILGFAIWRIGLRWTVAVALAGAVLVVAFHADHQGDRWIGRLNAYVTDSTASEAGAR
ncbi:hypothetical protein [Frankia sp. AgW1.1]|uniref:hypothetical protein n=1 Tax=Frankia sp. AgW1.1 TaxID=1836971 RepID=UPI001933E023|nr:hypothetical protein [Frankia sp. AgW1.1]MBL7487058.1 hypothetical protein [Frankia sp. AgW1.1]